MIRSSKASSSQLKEGLSLLELTSLSFQRGHFFQVEVKFINTLATMKLKKKLFKYKNLLGPSLQELVKRIEGCRKPVVAALYGTVYGGGCEIAMSAHYRIAQEGTLLENQANYLLNMFGLRKTMDWSCRFGFPEVTLGILPAAFGTQKFPRLCGIKAALKYIPTGQNFGCNEAQRIGLIDKVLSLMQQNIIIHQNLQALM